MPLQFESAMDALRLADNKLVYLKRIPKDSTEIQIAKFFSTGESAHDARNHCVPVLDYFEDENLAEYGILVMPLFRPFDDPEFHSIDEVLEFMRQTLEVRFASQHCGLV